MPDRDNKTSYAMILGLKITGTFPPRCPEDPVVFIIERGKNGFNAYAVRQAGVADGFGEELSGAAQAIITSGERYADLFASSSSTSTFLKVCEQILNTLNTGPRAILSISHEPRVDLGSIEEAPRG